LLRFETHEAALDHHRFWKEAKVEQALTRILKLAWLEEAVVACGLAKQAQKESEQALKALLELARRKQQVWKGCWGEMEC
jgi:hypothetical protein